ncbi:MAG: arginine repressor [Lachnospiraceae bacterium]|nr:arginine repressor [Lachnospiraceae bacterium]
MKKQRLLKIKELIEKYEIDTQEELCSRLNDAGFSATQATVSRDIRELKLTKISKSGGGFKYALLVESEHYLSDKYLRVLKDGYVSMEPAQNLLVIKTVSGMAMAVAAAIDSMKFRQIVGSIAGDDTIMMALKTNEDAVKVFKEIKSVIED